MAMQAQSYDSNRAPLRSRDPQQNGLLAALSPDDRVRFRTRLESTGLHAGDVLCESGTKYLYFPTTAIVSLLYVTRSGASSEIAVIGNDGVVGLTMGGNTQPIQSKVQTTGHAFRMRAHEADVTGPLLDILSRYARATNAQVAQTAVCNRHHTIDQQLCRRLLVGMDRLRSEELEMSHQQLANLLGVRRESVTIAAQRLQEAGVIRYSRGRIVILDRPQLEARACECYAVLQKEYERLLPPLVRPTTATTQARTGAIVTRRIARNASYSSSLLCGI